MTEVFGWDAKTSLYHLKREQGLLEAQAWDKAGDTYQRWETAARAIKDASKVTVYVGANIITAGGAGTAITLGQGVLVGVSGLSLTLEISEDVSIAFGDEERATLLRAVQEKIAPVTEIISIVSLKDIGDPNNLFYITNLKEHLDNFGEAAVVWLTKDGKEIVISPDKPKKAEVPEEVKKDYEKLERERKEKLKEIEEAKKKSANYATHKTNIQPKDTIDTIVRAMEITAEEYGFNNQSQIKTAATSAAVSNSYNKEQLINRRLYAENSYTDTFSIKEAIQKASARLTYMGCASGKPVISEQSFNYRGGEIYCQIKSEINCSYFYLKEGYFLLKAVDSSRWGEEAEKAMADKISAECTSSAVLKKLIDNYMAQ